MATFELYLKTGGRYCFDFKMDNGEAIFSSREFDSKKDCEEVIRWIKVNSLENLYNRNISAGDDYSFSLKDGKGKEVGLSERYISAPELTRKIDIVRNGAPNAEVIDLTIAEMEVDAFADHPFSTVI